MDELEQYTQGRDGSSVKFLRLGRRVRWSFDLDYARRRSVTRFLRFNHLHPQILGVR